MMNRDRELHEMADEGRALMRDFIKRTDALDIVADNNVTGEITLNRYDKIIDGIYEIPSVDVAPIRHGSWKEIFYGEAGGYTFFNVICNCCGYDMGDKMTPFCPNCGTKMDGELIRDERIF